MTGIGNGIWADNHVHSRFSHDSESELSDICKAAKEKNIGVVCITDHADVKPHSDMDQMMQIRKDVALAVAAEREKHPGMDLLLGIELACGGSCSGTVCGGGISCARLFGAFQGLFGSAHRKEAGRDKKEPAAALPFGGCDSSGILGIFRADVRCICRNTHVGLRRRCRGSCGKAFRQAQDGT